MTDVDVHLRCPGCGEPVLDGWKIVRCRKCAVLHHEKCWTKAGKCSGTTNCRGKWEEIVVARVPHAGPSSEELEQLVERTVESIVSRQIVALGQTIPRGEDLKRLGDEVQRQVDGVQVAIAEDVRAGIEDLARTVKELARKVEELDRRVRHLPRPAEPQNLEATEKRLLEQLETLTESGGVSDEQLETLRRQLSADLADTQRRIDECHFELSSLRHPLPWQDASGPLGALPREGD